MSTVYDARREFWNSTDYVVLVSGDSNSALRMEVNVTAGQEIRVKCAPRTSQRVERRLEPGSYFQSQYSLFNGAFLASEHVHRADTLKTCLKAQDLAQNGKSGL